jgi:hypothetical protein
LEAAGVKLQPAPSAYNKDDQQALRNELEDRDLVALKSDRHVELRAGVMHILRSPNGTRFYLTVDNAGVLSTTAV